MPRCRIPMKKLCLHAEADFCLPRLSLKRIWYLTRDWRNTSFYVTISSLSNLIPKIFSKKWRTGNPSKTWNSTKQMNTASLLDCTPIPPTFCDHNTTIMSPSLMLPWSKPKSTWSLSLFSPAAFNKHAHSLCLEFYTTSLLNLLGGGRVHNPLAIAAEGAQSSRMSQRLLHAVQMRAVSVLVGTLNPLTKFSIMVLQSHTHTWHKTWAASSL